MGYFLFMSYVLLSEYTPVVYLHTFTWTFRTSMLLWLLLRIKLPGTLVYVSTHKVHAVGLCLIFKAASKLFSRVVVLFYFAPKQFYFCHILRDSFSFYFIVVCFPFSWWAMVLNNFSCVNLLSTYLLWGGVYSNFCLLFNYVKFLTCTVLYVFLIQVFIRHVICKYFLPVCASSLHSLDSVFRKTNF